MFLATTPQKRRYLHQLLWYNISSGVNATWHQRHSLDASGPKMCLTFGLLWLCVVQVLVRSVEIQPSYMQKTVKMSKKCDFRRSSIRQPDSLLGWRITGQPHLQNYIIWKLTGNVVTSNGEPYYHLSTMLHQLIWGSVSSSRMTLWVTCLIVLPFISTNITSAVYQVFINAPDHSEWFLEPRNVDFIATKLLHSWVEKPFSPNKDYLNKSGDQVGKTSTWIFASCFQ